LPQGTAPERGTRGNRNEPTFSFTFHDRLGEKMHIGRKTHHACKGSTLLKVEKGELSNAF